jgi:hypothetical protein
MIGRMDRMDQSGSIHYFTGIMDLVCGLFCHLMGDGMGLSRSVACGCGCVCVCVCPVFGVSRD